MKNIFKKITKGLLALLTLKLIIIGGLFVFQSCKTENNFIEQQEQAKTDFLASLSKSQDVLESTPVYSQDDLQNMRIDVGNETISVCLMAFDSSTDTTDIVDSISNLEDFLTLSPQYNLTTIVTPTEVGNSSDTTTDTADSNTTTDYNPDDCIAIIQIPAQPIVDALDPTVQAAKNFLLTRNLTDDDITEILDGENTSLLVPLVYRILEVENDAENTISYQFSKLLGVQSVYAQGVDWGVIGGCATATIGLDSFQTLKDALIGKKVTGRALKRAAKKVVKKFAKSVSGWGTLLMVAEFVGCVAFGGAF